MDFTAQPLTESDIEPSEEQNTLPVIITSSVMSTLFVILVLVAAIVTITAMLYKRFVKVALQVIDHDVDNQNNGETKLPSHKYMYGYQLIKIRSIC